MGVVCWSCSWLYGGPGARECAFGCSQVALKPSDEIYMPYSCIEIRVSTSFDFWLHPSMLDERPSKTSKDHVIKKQYLQTLTKNKC